MGKKTRPPRVETVLEIGWQDIILGWRLPSYAPSEALPLHTKEMMIWRAVLFNLETVGSLQPTVISYNAIGIHLGEKLMWCLTFSLAQETCSKANVNYALTRFRSDDFHAPSVQNVSHSSDTTVISLSRQTRASQCDHRMMKGTARDLHPRMYMTCLF